MSKQNNNRIRIQDVLLLLISCILIFTVSAGGTYLLRKNSSEPQPEEPAVIPPFPDVFIMDAFDNYMETVMADAKAAAESVHKFFWIDETAEQNPVPNSDNYGQASSPGELQWLLNDAAALLDGQATLFNPKIEILEGSVIHYYLDDSIMAITWKQVYSDIVFTISEVKVAHASQFRRYIADDTYDSRNHYYCEDMAALNNAVVASSADFYRNRPYGTLVYESQIYKMQPPHNMDICFVDKDGNLNFTARKEITTVEALQTYVDEHDINFSICFGPVLVDNGIQCNPESYSLGEIHDGYPRAALCQFDDLHYIVLTATAEGKYSSFLSVHKLADIIATFGVEKAYVLDGGQTANLVMNNQLINKVNYPTLRPMSDIIYFATAVPSNENTGSRN